MPTEAIIIGSGSSISPNIVVLQPISGTKHCEICQVLFMPETTSNKYCTEECLTKARKLQQQKYYNKHKTSILKTCKNYRDNHKKIRKLKAKIYRKTHKEETLDYVTRNKQKIAADKRKWCIKNLRKITDMFHEYYIANILKIKKRVKLYRLNNKDKVNKNIANRLKTDVNFKILCCLRARLRMALKGRLKLSTTMNLIGCSCEFLKIYLEKKFKKNMTWSNHGIRGWHIDHIVPCRQFNLSKEEDQYRCFHYSNLQPMWAKDNLKKGAKYDPSQ